MKNSGRMFSDDLTDTWFKLGIVFGVFVLISIPLFYMFGEYLAHGGIRCGFYHVTHLYCPGCGGTRSYYYLVHGYLFKSFIFNPFVPYTIADYIFFMVNAILVKNTKKAGFAGFPVTGTIYAGIGILLGQWVIRNILLVFFKITCL